jgi:hypothetical protein
MTDQTDHVNDLSLLANAIDIQDWLADDTQTPYSERVRRDHAIARQIQTDHVDHKTVIAWWSAVARPQKTNTGDKFEAIGRVAGLSLFLAGLVIGVSTTALALTYTGNYPVNLLSLLGILLGLPLLFLVFTGVTGILSALGLHSGLRLPVGIKRPLLAWLDRVANTRFHHALGHRDVSAKVAYWLLLRISQWFTVGFFVAAIVTTFALVSFSDLAFGWSTTLEVEPQTIHTLFSLLAWPWQNWLPVAAPSPELVEVSQYLRAQAIGEHASLLGQWWPFVIMCLLVWGLLPRLLLLLIAGWRLRQVATQFLLAHTEVVALLDRLRSPAIGFTHSDLTGSSRPETNEPAPEQPAASDGGIDLSWNQAATGEQITQLSAAMKPDERATCIANLRDSLASQPADRRSIRLFTKGWEPPMHDFMDCVRDLVQQLAPQSIRIVPLHLLEDEANSDDHEQWRLAVAKAGIPRVYVIPYDGADP